MCYPSLRRCGLWTSLVAYLLLVASRMGPFAADASATPRQRPHLVIVLADDLGWANVGWHRPSGYTEVQTPALDALVAAGIALEQMYAYQFCSPSRCALQVGRNPLHVNTLNVRIFHRVLAPYFPRVCIAPRPPPGMGVRSTRFARPLVLSP